MGKNNNGHSGVSTEFVSMQKKLFVGVQSPNKFPSVKTWTNGKSLPVMKNTTNGGTQILSTAGYDAQYADTSWLSHSGIYTVAVGNKIVFTCGAGGFQYATSGPSKMASPFQDFLCENCFNVNTRLFTVASTQRTHLMGKRIDIDYDEIYIDGAANFTNNVQIHGGLYVNGETYMAHMTTQEQMNFTNPCAGIDSFVNPAQSFVMFNGASIQARALVKPTVGTVTVTIPEEPGDIDCVIKLPLPEELGGQLITVPCKVAFPSGISLMSDGIATAMPETIAIFNQADKRPVGSASKKSDTYGPGHVHSFIGPACNYVKNTGDLYSQVKNVMQSGKLANAKATTTNGCSSIDQLPQMMQTAAQNSLKEWLKSFWDRINPFS